MIWYAVNQNWFWRCIDTETMPLEHDEVFQEEQPSIINKEPE